MLREFIESIIFSNDSPYVYTDRLTQYPEDWNIIRRNVYKRAGYHCEKCGETGRVLHAHHKIPLSQGGNNSMDNLMALCESCHMDEHPHMRIERGPLPIKFTDVTIDSVASMEQILDEINADLHNTGCSTLCNNELERAIAHKDRNRYYRNIILLISMVTFPIWFLLFSQLFSVSDPIIFTFLASISVCLMIFFILFKLLEPGLRDENIPNVQVSFYSSPGDSFTLEYNETFKDLRSLERHISHEYVILKDTLIIMDGKKLVICDISESRLQMLSWIAELYNSRIWVVSVNKQPLFKIHKYGVIRYLNYI